MNSVWQIEALVVGQLATNCYLVIDKATKLAAVVDPGDDAEYISDKIERLGAKPKFILATHGHFDHLLASRALALAYQIPIYLSPHDRFLVRRMVSSSQHFLGFTPDPPPSQTKPLKDGQLLALGKTSFKVLLTPGHTPGSVTLAVLPGQALLVGDLLFAEGGVGRTDYHYSNPDDLNSSLTQIFKFPKSTLAYPGHGRATTVGQEARFHNLQQSLCCK